MKPSFYCLFLLVLILALSACVIKPAEYPSLWEIYDPITFAQPDGSQDYLIVVEPINSSDLPIDPWSKDGVEYYEIMEATSSTGAIVTIGRFYDPKNFEVTEYQVVATKYFRVYVDNVRIYAINMFPYDAMSIMYELCKSTGRAIGVEPICF